MMKKMKMNRIVTSVVMLLFGIVLFLYPGEMIRAVVYVIAGVLFLHGMLSLVEYLKNKKNGRTDIASFVGMILCLVGAGFIMVGYRMILSIVPVVIGIILIAGGIMRLEDASSMRKSGISGTVPIVLAVVNLLLGAVMILNPFGTLQLTLRIGGIMLAYSGGTDLFSHVFSTKKTDGIIDVEEGRDGIYKNSRR